MTIRSKFKLCKVGSYYEDSKFGYTVDNIVYDPTKNEVAIAFIQTNAATNEQKKFVETVTLTTINQTITTVADDPKPEAPKPQPRRTPRPPVKAEEVVAPVAVAAEPAANNSVVVQANTTPIV
jgi:hypothetical protein